MRTREAAVVLNESLRALDRLGANGEWEFDGVALALTNLDKVLFPPRRTRDRPVTKRDLIRYYASIAPSMLPYLADRALNMHRYPNGVDKPGFWHKEVPSHAPEWITRWHYEAADPDETQYYIVADRPATLPWLANFGAVELHAWTSTIDAPEQPTYALIDVDPGDDTTWKQCLMLVDLYRTALEHLGVHGFPKLTGRRGVQVWIPIRKGPLFAETRAWVEEISRAIGALVPDLVSWRWEKRERGGLARLDYTQNAINKTLVAPYSVRAGAGAPVSVPIAWDELSPRVRSDRWTIRDVPARLHETGDPFRPMLDAGQDLPSFG
jgi:bifunctional non-homologous end joining protein LigD